MTSIFRMLLSFPEHQRRPRQNITVLMGMSNEIDSFTSDSWMPFARISRMRRIVAFSDCRFKLMGGRRNMPLDIA